MAAFRSLIVIALVITGLVVGKDFLLPIAIAFLFTTLIAATADRLVRLGVPGAASLAAALAVFLLGLVGIFYILAGQIDAVNAAWPRYVERLKEIADQLAEWAGPNISAKVSEGFDKMDLSRTVPGLLGSAGSFLGTAALVFLYSGFMLAERGTVTGKLEGLFAKSDQSEEARRTLDEIIQGVRDYLWIKTIMSFVTAIVSYAVLKSLGVDFAETWALLIFFLNYIPSIGSMLGVAFPAVLALVQFDTMWQFMFIVIVLAGAQFVIGNIIEPAFMGRTLNLSPFVVIVSLTFWGMMWGIVGAFLSVPLTATLAIACAKIPAYRWISVLLSEDGSLNGEKSETAAR